jgi:hypothetical protein
MDLVGPASGFFGLFVAVIAAFALRRRLPAFHARRWIVGALVLVVAVGPFLAPQGAYLVRTLAAGLGISAAVKLLDLAQGRAHPSVLSSPLVFLAWFLVAPADGLPARALRSGVRAAGRWRLERALVKGTFLVTIIQVKPLLGASGLALDFLLALQVYLMVAGLADVVTGVLMQTGIACDEAFDAPFLAASPAEFWGRRWNLFVTRFFNRHLFRSLARRRHAVAAIVLVFSISGLAHEYFAAAVLGLFAYQPGYMMAFFALHGTAVALPRVVPAVRRLSRFPRVLRVATHLVWMTLTAPLFTRPIAPILIAFDATCRAWLGVAWGWLRYPS